VLWRSEREKSWRELESTELEIAAAEQRNSRPSLKGEFERVERVQGREFN
jgi:hypothetical protein